MRAIYGCCECGACVVEGAHFDVGDLRGERGID